MGISLNVMNNKLSSLCRITYIDAILKGVFALLYYSGLFLNNNVEKIIPGQIPVIAANNKNTAGI